MKKSAIVLCFTVACAWLAPSQEIFDAVRQRDLRAVKALIEKSPELVAARDSDGMTLLHYAAKDGDTELLNYLIDRGAKIELQDGHHKTPLHLAAMNDRKDALAALLKRGASLETKDDYGRTALILCARELGQAAAGRILLDAGADVGAADKFGDTALSLAAWRGKSEFIDLLLKKGTQVPASGPRWEGMLSQAVSQGLTTLFRRLTDKSQDLKALDASGQWLLHSAAAGGSAEIVGVLLEKGFDPARADRFGWTPLHYAALNGRAEVARVLIERAAPLDIRTIMGQTAYNVALERKMEAAAGLLAEKGADKSDIRFPVLEGDYLGQKPPGDKPELFGLGIISSIWGLHSTAVFSPDGNEVYWTPMVTFPGEIYSRGGLLMMKRVNGRWTSPSWAPFSGPNGQDDVPFFSPDGKRIYFISRRPLPGEKQAGSEKIWYADRTASRWSQPRPLDPSVNSVDMHWEFSLDRNGNIYFAGQPPDSRGLSDIYLARFRDGKYEKPLNLGEPINSPGPETSPFIAPDGSYLLFSRQYDIWVSFRGPDGAWSAPVKLGPEVNSPSVELCPIVTADGKYLFFLSQRDGESYAYWVRADVIEKLRPVEDIHEAVKDGDLSRIKEILRKNPGRLGAKDSYDRTPLLVAVLSKQEEIFKFLLAQGADVNQADKEGIGALLLASFMGLDEWARLLILKGAELDSHADVLGYTPLHAAVRRGHKKCAELLLSKGARLDPRDTGGNTPLLLAAWYGQADMVRWLLSKGASPGDKDNLGSTPLHLASLNGYKDIVTLLVSSGAALDEKNLRNGTPLSIAAREGQKEIIKILLEAGAKRSSLESTILQGEYLGQKRPGLTAELFAPGIVSTEKRELNSVFTPDGKEFYFTVQTIPGPWKIMVMKLKDNAWTNPQVAPFSGAFSDVDLFISPDGQKLYFCSNRPASGKGEPEKDYDVWVVERTGEKWSEPKNMGAPINSDQDEFYPSITKDGTIYFQSARAESRGGRNIYRARLENGHYQKAERLDEAINCEQFVGDALISPDERYLIFSVNRPEGFGQGDLYVSFRGRDDSWTKPQNMGNRVNTKANENCPILSPDGKYIFYTSGGDIYWISAAIIEKLKPNERNGTTGIREVSHD